MSRGHAGEDRRQGQRQTRVWPFQRPWRGLGRAKSCFKVAMMLGRDDQAIGNRGAAEGRFAATRIGDQGLLGVTEEGPLGIWTLKDWTSFKLKDGPALAKKPRLQYVSADAKVMKKEKERGGYKEATGLALKNSKARGQLLRLGRTRPCIRLELQESRLTAPHVQWNHSVSTCTSHSFQSSR